MNKLDSEKTMTVSYNLEPVWDSVLNIYDVFCEICNRHNLRHYVYWGTLLGAVRHHGFIPWDDDFDVAMPREDYEKLIEVAPQELPENLQMLSWKTDSNYKHVFNKIKCKDEYFVQKVREASHLKLSEGLYIDIFPLDGAPSTKLGEMIYWGKRRCLRSVGVFLQLIYEHRFIVKYTPLYLLGMLFWPFYYKVKSSDEMNLEIEKWAKSYPFSVEKCSVYCQSDVARFVPENCFTNVEMFDFSPGRKVPVPVGYDKILKGLYGDYMTMPPLEQRVPKHQLP